MTGGDVRDDVRGDARGEVLTTWWSRPEPLLYVLAMVELHGSEYHGIASFSVALLTEIV